MRRLILLLTLCALAAPFGDVGALSLAPVPPCGDAGTPVLDPGPAQKGSELSDPGAFLPAGAPAEAVPERDGGGHGPSAGDRARTAGCGGRSSEGAPRGVSSKDAEPSAPRAGQRGLVANPSTAPPHDA